MKAIDLHIHTISTITDWDFTFSLDNLKKYIEKAKLDAIAITNHNKFNLEQFEEIRDAIDIHVFPGVEVDLENGHILVIAENSSLEEFSSKVQRVENKIKTQDCSINLMEFKNIFGNLDEYLLIPHIDKKPPINAEILQELNDHIYTGEVSSPKKFIRMFKDKDQKLTPVLFSDSRISEKVTDIKHQRTFLDIGDINLSSLKTALKDKNKVRLSKNEGNKLFLANSNNLELSTGLNVILGQRASGKTILLDSIEENNKNVKYIKQFELIKDGFNKNSTPKDRDEKLSKELIKKYSRHGDNYLEEFKDVVNNMIEVNKDKDELLIEEYIESLKKYASKKVDADNFGQAKLFNESPFSKEGTKNLDTLIGSLENIITNKQYYDQINKYLDFDSLKELIVELCDIRITLANQNKLKGIANEIIKSTQQNLRAKSSTPHIKQVNFEDYLVVLDKIDKFNNIVVNLQERKQKNLESVASKYNVVMDLKEFEGASEIQRSLRVQYALAFAYTAYDNPYLYLKKLEESDLDDANLYKCFVKITYNILNSDGLSVSGGEYAEFNLINAIEEAHDKDMLLIDEPESSFDNLFLRNDINELLKEWSENMPVVISTHNNTVGLSIKPDYIVHTRKERENGEILFRSYTGKPKDNFLYETNNNGLSIRTNEVLIDHLEGGQDNYSERRDYYDV